MTIDVTVTEQMVADAIGMYLKKTMGVAVKSVRVNVVAEGFWADRVGIVYSGFTAKVETSPTETSTTSKQG